MTHFQSTARQILRESLAPLVNEPSVTKGIVDAQTHSAWMEYIAGFSTSSAEAARAGWAEAKVRVLEEMFPKWFGRSTSGDGSLLF